MKLIQKSGIVIQTNGKIYTDIDIKEILVRMMIVFQFSLPVEADLSSH